MFDVQWFTNNFFPILSALPVTLGISLISIVIGAIFGLLLTIVRVKKIPVLNGLASIIISFNRSMPMLVVLYILYYSLPYLMGAVQGNYSVEVGVQKLPPNLVAILAFSLTTSAYFSEVFRSAYYSVEKGQYEAAQSIGLSNYRIFKNIILPQATIEAIPNFTSVSIDLIKDTSLIYTISVVDIMARANMLAVRGFYFIEAYLIVLIIYWAICFSLYMLLHRLEGRLNAHNSI